MPSIAKLVSGLEGGEGVMGDVGRYVEGRRDPLGEGATPLFAAVAVCAGQVVGVAVLRQEEVGVISWKVIRNDIQSQLPHCSRNEV